MPGLGACHALDVGFVFGNVSPSFCGEGPKVEKLSQNIQDGWLAFARTGNPSCQSWASGLRYGHGRQTMMLGEECHIEKAPHEEERRAWEPIPNKFLG